MAMGTYFLTEKHATLEQTEIHASLKIQQILNETRSHFIPGDVWGAGFRQRPTVMHLPPLEQRYALEEELI